MKKHANYTILPELRLILECCKGPAIVEDAILMKTDELADELYNPDYRIIVDFRGFETNLDSNTKDSTKRFFDFLISAGINSRVAILTAAPHQVVISLFLKSLSANLGSVEIEAFSTVDAAHKFLGIPNEYTDLINSRIVELNNNTV